MNLRDSVVITFLLSIIGIVISAIILQKQYFDFHYTIALMIYTIPALILSLINGFVLSFKKSMNNRRILRVLLVPILLFFGLLIDFEGPIGYLAIFGLIPVMLVNLIWLLKNLKSNNNASV